MASTDSTAVVQTVACDLGNCGNCRGVVFSITGAHLADCGHECHDQTPDQGEEEVALDALADLALERDLEDLHFAEGWS